MYNELDNTMIQNGFGPHWIPPVPEPPADLTLVEVLIKAVNNGVVHNRDEQDLLYDAKLVFWFYNTDAFDLTEKGKQMIREYKGVD